MQQHWLGKMLLVGLVSLLSCRNSIPPKIEICIGDGFGGADCVEADGTKKYRPPSELLDYWSTNETDMQAFSSWCYDAGMPSTRKSLKIVKSQIIDDNSE